MLLTPGVSGHRVRALIGLGDSRLNSAVQARHEGGQFRFQMTQPGSSDPVSYNPCREIEYVVNPAGAPDDYSAMVEQAVSRVSGATGFRFSYEGTTDDRSFDQRHRTSLLRQPVLIGWATPDEVPGLAGRVAGLGGSSAVQRTPAHLAYVTGVVALDRDSFAEMSERPEGFDLERAILMHELGHVVGLAHVEDPGELMYDDNVGQTSFGPGDREGLALLGQADCL